jgi:hypothetical protein
MAIGSSDDRTLWDLDIRPLDGYADFEDFGSIGTHEAEVDIAASGTTLQNDRTKPKGPPTPVTRPNPRNPNRAPIVAPATAYTPGVLNCVRGEPPRRVVPKKPR